jgi:DNA gyrase subunit A
MPVVDGDEVMLITNRGMLIRMPAAQISVIGRNTQGVRLITVESREEQVAGVARVAENVAVAGEGAAEVAGDAAIEEADDPGDAPAGGEDGPGGEPA